MRDGTKERGNEEIERGTVPYERKEWE